MMKVRMNGLVSGESDVVGVAQRISGGGAIGTLLKASSDGWMLTCVAFNITFWVMVSITFGYGCSSCAEDLSCL